MPGYGTLPSSSSSAVVGPAADRSPPPAAPPSWTSSAGDLFTLVKDRSRSTFVSMRPWRSFLNPFSLSRPQSYSDTVARARRNLSHYRVNYALVVLIIMFLSLLWEWKAMLVFLAVFVLWLFFYFSRDSPMEVCGRRIDDRIVLGLLSVVTIVALVLTHVGLHVLISLIVGLVLVVLHAALRITEDQYLDERESAADGGLLSVVGSPPAARWNHDDLV